jgi:neutral amino acid transport system ATP-binding protein
MVDKISKGFGGLILFDQVNLAINTNTINCLIGSNGAGKTTFFNMLTGYEKPDQGSIWFGEKQITHYPAYKIARSGIGKLWQEPTIFPNHTVLENLLVSDQQHPGEQLSSYLFRPRLIKRKESELHQKAHVLLGRFRLSPKYNQKAGSLSAGEKKLVGLSMLLLNDAKLLLLDEPFSGIKSDTIERVAEVLFALPKEGKTVFMIEHKIKFALPMCHHTYRIENTKIELLN